MIRIAGVLHQPIETLSKGFKRRVGVAQALLHDPDVLILDEPTDGLDPNQKYEMRRIIGAMRPEKAIIISTHLLEEVEAVCSRAIIIAHGRILADGTPHSSPNARAITMPFGSAYACGIQPQVRAELTRLPGVAAVEAVSDSEGDALMIFPRDDGPVVAEGRRPRPRPWLGGHRSEGRARPARRRLPRNH